MKTIVISAVNLNAGGTLKILTDCLKSLSEMRQNDYRVVAIVYKKELAHFPGIEYIETQWPKKRWLYRLWYEYVSLKNISRALGPVYLWLSLHDTTPNVVAERRAVYCHNPFPFHQWKLKEWFLSPRIVLLAIFSKFIYQKNLKKNNMVIVQQQWIRDAFKGMFNLSADKIIVALPQMADQEYTVKRSSTHHRTTYSFLFPAWANSHKNFECLCKATALLEARNIFNFKVYLTISKGQNRYSEWLYKNWGKASSALHFIGFQSRKSLFDYYQEVDCLVYPSKVETWGLPISEFATFGKPMLLADLPYSYETAAGSEQVAFFNPDNHEDLANLMMRLIERDRSFLNPVPSQQHDVPVARSWDNLFGMLLKS